MAYVYVEATDILDDLSDDELRNELTRREARHSPQGTREVTERVLLDKVWQHFRGRPDVPECLSEYVWRVLGKCL